MQYPFRQFQAQSAQARHDRSCSTDERSSSAHVQRTIEDGPLQEAAGDRIQATRQCPLGANLYTHGVSSGLSVREISRRIFEASRPRESAAGRDADRELPGTGSAAAKDRPDCAPARVLPPRLHYAQLWLLVSGILQGTADPSQRQSLQRSEGAEMTARKRSSN